MANIISPEKIPRKRKGCFILSIVLIVGGILFVSAFLYFLLRWQRVDNLFEKGNNHYDQGVKIGRKALELLTALEIQSDSQNLKKESNKIMEKLPLAEKELKAAEANFKQMERSSFAFWEKKTAKLSSKSAKEARSGIKTVKKLLLSFNQVVDLMVKLKAGSEKFDEAFKKNLEAVSLNNTDKFGEARDMAGQAGALFREAKDLISEADKIDPSAGLAVYIEQIAKGEEWANNSLKMADLGLQKRLPEYNKLVEENNRLDDEVIKVSKAKIILDPEGWAKERLQDSIENLQRHLNKANELREKALRLWNKHT